MILKQLELNHFRNYYKETFVAGESINLIFGENGHGKTNLLEAIYYLALCQSFRASSDKDCINYYSETDFFNIKGLFKNRFDSEETIVVKYSKKESKQIMVNQLKEDRLKDHIGRIPAVLLKPDDLKLSFGGPAERRRFIDVLLSQISSVYVDNLMRYKRAIKQKNSILKAPQVDKEQLKSWNENLVTYGSEIIRKRIEIIENLNSYLSKFYQDISGQADQLKLDYLSNVTGDDVKESFRRMLDQHYESELHQRISLVGPHRDDLSFYINSKNVSDFGSQGENKTFIISLKLSEMKLLLNFKEEKPLLIFDDVFNELDQFRVENLLSFLTEIGQVFISTTNEHLIDGDKVTKFHIDNGKLKQLVH